MRRWRQLGLRAGTLLGGAVAAELLLRLVAPWLALTIRAFQLVNLRALYSQEIDQSRDESIDYYSFVRSAWTQNRRYRVLEAKGEEASPKFDDAQVDLYYIDVIIDADADEPPAEYESGTEPDTKSQSDEEAREPPQEPQP